MKTVKLTQAYSYEQLPSIFTKRDRTSNVPIN